MKKLLMTLLTLAAMAFTLTGCDQEQKREIVTAALKAYGDVRPEVIEGAISYAQGDINKTQLINIGIKFGNSYVVERFLRGE